jgi:uncharacterized membrane protein
MLSTIAASMITVAGVTFSITIVALTLASQQFGPRLLRNLLRDLGNQVTLGTFIATYLFCLLVLRTVSGTEDRSFVPHLAVTTGVALAILSIGVLIFFIHHIATSIQASQVIAGVAGELERAIERLFPERIGQSAAECPGASSSVRPAPSFDGARIVSATQSGYVQAVDGDMLLKCVREGAAVVRVDARPGSFVRAGAALAAVAASRPADDTLERAVRGAFVIGADRTGTQDAGFFVSQLVQLAVRALSPGINDPATARGCIDRLEQMLGELAGRRLPAPHRHDAQGVLRVIASPVTFAGMLDLAFTEISRHARHSVSVSCRLLGAIRNLAERVPNEADRRALLDQAWLVGDGRGSGLTHAADLAAIAVSFGETLAALDAAKTRSRRDSRAIGPPALSAGAGDGDPPPH